MPVLTRKNPTDANEQTAPTKQPRRGVTAMEYLMMLSLIIVACLVAVGYLGSANNNNMNASSTSINKAIKKGG